MTGYQLPLFSTRPEFIFRCPCGAEKKGRRDAIGYNGWFLPDYKLCMKKRDGDVIIGICNDCHHAMNGHKREFGDSYHVNPPRYGECTSDWLDRLVREDLRSEKR